MLLAMRRDGLFGLADPLPKVLGIARKIVNCDLPFSRGYKVYGY